MATANPGYKFSKWTVNGTKVNGAGSSYTFNVTADRALVAVFKPVYTVSVTCDPVEIDGDAFEAAADTKPPAGYEPGEKVVMEISHTVPGYSFVNWTENGVPVSDHADFTFNATGNRHLVAHFAFGKRIDLLADPKTAGDVTGEGVFPTGTPVTVSAEARPGYIFIGWTEKDASAIDVYVSNDAEYNFTASAVPRLLTARFITLPKLSVAPAATPGLLDFIWPDAPGWLLEESGDLATWDITTRNITTANGQRSVTVNPNEDKVFFRLKHP